MMNDRYAFQDRGVHLGSRVPRPTMPRTPAARRNRVLVIDNVDSFAHNLGRYLVRLGLAVDMYRNYESALCGIVPEEYDALVLSPGPCMPDAAGFAPAVTERFLGRCPILGVCLGHQILAWVCGGRLVPAPELVHGRASWIEHDGRGEFAGLANPMRVGRYHSLVVERESLPTCFEVSAWLDDQTIMAMRHRTHPAYGWQFHPESILTAGGYALLAGFLGAVGLPTTTVPEWQSELGSGVSAAVSPPEVPLTPIRAPLTNREEMRTTD